MGADHNQRGAGTLRLLDDVVGDPALHHERGGFHLGSPEAVGEIVKHAPLEAELRRNLVAHRLGTCLVADEVGLGRRDVQQSDGAAALLRQGGRRLDHAVGHG